MKILYGSVGGSTRRVARRVQAALGECAELWDVARLLREGGTFAPSDLVVCSPTYGDGELEADLERAIVAHPWAGWSGCRVAFCEVGIYTGYDEFGHGLLPLMRHHFGAAGLVESFVPLSIDSAPLGDDDLAERWAKGLRDAWGIGHG